MSNVSTFPAAKGDIEDEEFQDEARLEEFFAETQYSKGLRLSEKVEAPKDQSEEEDEALPPTPATWATTPEFPGQYEQEPESVRLRGQNTEILDLSIPEQLLRWNVIQNEVNKPDPSLQILASERHFYEGRFIQYVTLVSIFYKRH